MQKRIPLFYKGVPGGSVICTYDKARYILCAECPDTIPGLVRAFVGMSQEPGAILPIGVMMPEEGGVLRACRSFTRNDLLQAGVDYDKLDRGEIKLCKSFQNSDLIENWKHADAPEILFNDIVLQKALKGSEVLVDDLISPRRAAARLDPRLPFALAPAFCLVRPIHINGTLYAAVDIDKNRRPVL